MKIWRQRENINEKYNEVMKMACGGVAASAKAASVSRSMAEAWPERNINGENRKLAKVSCRMK
jgi:hypothetical protein